MVMGSYAQVTVGEGTNTAQVAPFNAYYGYTYSQSIYLGSEINAAGSITSIQWYYNGTGTMPNSQGLTIYLGLTDKTEFESNLDYVSVQDLTAVYTGGIVTGGTAGWKTITFTTPFPYDGVSNLIVAVDENMSGYDASTDKFRNTSVASNRTIFAYSDGINYDPADPTNNFGGFGTRGMVAFVPNIIFGGITQSCATPTGVTTSGVINTEATINWPANGNTAWEVYIAEQSAPAPTASTVGVTVTGNPTYLKTGLTQNTAYSAYVRLKCSETLFSAWSTPRNFITACDAIGVPFLENFNSDSTTLNCWKVIDGNGDGDLWGLYTSSPIEGDRSVTLNTDGNAGNNNDWLIMPRITLTGTQQLSFKYKVQSASEPNDLRVVLSTTGSEQADFTNVVMPLTSFNNTTAAKKVIPLAGYTGDVFIAFHVPAGGLDGWRLYIDEVEVDEAPSTPPVCVEDVNVVPNEGCGNFATVFTWPAVDGADGYKVYIGTSPNGQNLVVDGVDVGPNLTYSFVGNPGTTYYYTIKSYNAFGLAVNCFEDTFSTYDDGCYCVSVPTSNDNAGVTNVQINDTNTAVTDVTYADFTENGAIEITQGVNTIMSVTLETGYSYATNVWIDLNDNYTFEPSELFFQGLDNVSNIVPTVVNTSFMTPLTAALGEHRMRIVTTDAYQTIPNPCYNGSYGVTMDFLVEVVPAPACLPPSASTVTGITANGATLNWVSTASLFNVEVVYAGESQGSGEVVTGVTGLTLPVSNLDAQTDYSYYIQTDCGSGSLSPWTGPFNFRTACEAFGEFTEDFTTEQSIPAPECWYTIKSTTDQYANIIIYSYNDYVQLYNSGDVNAALYLITPSLTDLPLNTHRVKFKTFSYSTGVSLVVGTMSDPSNASTFTAVQTIPMTEDSTEYAISFANSTTDTHVAFKFVGTATYQYAYVDDVVWEPAPTTVPACLTDVNVETNSNCGNFASSITWTPVEGADFYTVTVGTTAGQGTPVIVGNVSSYDFVGNFATTYYYTVVPGNAFGNATECVGGTFTTADGGCYCESIPEGFIDGDGITSLTVAGSTFEIPLASYIDLTTDSAVVIDQNELVDFSITFETGYTYDSHIWVDWNDNLTFETSEKMYTGVSTNAIPSLLTSSFMPPADAALGVHRMRIGTADSGQFTPNPCYSGFYGITIDLNVDVTSLGVADFDNQSFSAYPNPVKDILNINYTQNITDVTVYNILGQQVLNSVANANKTQLDMSSLATGTYLVKVKTENAVKTIKVIKE